MENQLEGRGPRGREIRVGKGTETLSSHLGVGPLCSQPPSAIYIPGLPVPSRSGCEQMAVQFEAFCAGGLAPGWSLLVQGQADSGEDRFEINFLSETGDIAFHVKPRFSSATVVGNAFQGGHWGPEEVSNIFPLAVGEPFEMEVSSDAEHFHVYAQEHKVLQFPHRQRPLGIITRVRVLSDHHLAQVELAKRGLSWG
ncbi:grifin isoform X2 [Sapajus apella]|nr:grifin isoform X2 [Sapajus apella]